MSFEFIIPVDHDGLLNKTSVNQFVVDEVLSLREIPCALQDAHLALRGKGALSIMENFDVFFSILWFVSNLVSSCLTMVKRVAKQHDCMILCTFCCPSSNENALLSTTLQDKSTVSQVSDKLKVCEPTGDHSLNHLMTIKLASCNLNSIAVLSKAVDLWSTDLQRARRFVDCRSTHRRKKVAPLLPSDIRYNSVSLVFSENKLTNKFITNSQAILSFLSLKSYAMRNGILGLMGEIVIKVLSKDDLDSKQKMTREQFMDELEDHLHDCHAFVRSKCLQIWMAIVNEKCLPLHRQENITKIVIGRLQDKSSQVRRHAIQLITALLKSNPFASKLPVEELQQNYEKEQEKLNEMMPEESQSVDDHLKEKLYEEWSGMKKRICTFLESDEGPEDNEIVDCENVENTSEQIFIHIIDGKYEEAVQLARIVLKNNPVVEVNEEEVKNGENKENFGVDVEQSGDGHHENINSNVVQLIEQIFYDFKKSSLVTATEAVESSQESQTEEVVNDLTKQQVLVQYLKDSTAFAQQIQEAVPCICHLLGSKSVTDIMEAIEFFVTGYEFGVLATIQGIRRMLLLIWSKEQSVKDAVVAAYKRLYFSPDSGNARSRAQVVVKNLTALLYGATIANVSSMEALIVELMKSGEFEGTVIQILWERFTMKLPNTTQEDSRAAILLLSMVASAETEIVKSNIEVLVKEGLGPRAEADFVLARNTCTALLKLAASKKMKGELASEPFRLSETHEIFTRLTGILVVGIQQLKNHYWIPLAEQAVKVIYKLSEHPDKICGNLLKQLAQQVINMQSDETQASKDEENGSLGTGAKCSSGVLARLFSLAGQVALQQLVHLDLSVFGEMKRRIAKQEEKKNKKPTKSITDTATKIKDNSNEAIEEELGMTGAAAEDAQSEYIRKICETEIVTGQNLLATFVPAILEVCTNRSKYNDPHLRAAASLALAKFMLVSSEFCESHLQLLFTILEKSASPVIRANIIIALGDLSFRFPNLIEPWTPHLYARLRDDSPSVRKNTMQVLTHLILNDMVKVKGLISEMASCLVDDDERICNLAKVFFHELAKKGNAVYNIMPDVISRLSDPDVGVEEKSFRAIMKVLFQYIQKDKQCESLVEKLCHRYRATRVDRQWRDLSFCLSMLSYNEKSLRKLQENFTCFADKLADDEVHGCFCTIISKSRSFAKPEAKVLIDELEQRIEQCHNKGLEEGDIAKKAGQASSQAAALKNARKTPGKHLKTPGNKGKKKGSNRRVLEDDDECENVTPAPDRCQRRTGRQKPKVSFSSDEESDIELFDVEKSKSNTVVPKDDESDDLEDSPLLSKRPARSSRKGAGKKKHPLMSLNSPV
ncbi:hypothetical protein ScPMuIL_009542 [Solemya velum]